MTSATASQFDLTSDQLEVQDLARQFAGEKIAPFAADWDRNHTFHRPLYDELGQLGLMGVCVPEEYGGAGMDFLSYCLVIEELSRADASVGVTIGVHTSASTMPIVACGTPEQKQKYVPSMASGEVIGAFALTEPGSGSDAGSLRTSATAQADGSWSINGTKQWITNGSHAGVFITFARTDTESRVARGVSCFIVDGEAPGLSVLREEEKMGLHASSTADMGYDNVAVPAEGLIGEVDHGFRVAMSTLDGGRIGVAAQAIGIAQGAYDAAAAYSLEREQFGKRLADFQATQFRLADMATQIAAARALMYRAAALKDAGRPHSVEAAQAKLFASTTARVQTAEAIQVFGGYGYTKEFPVERYYRDAKITEIYEGTSEIQRIVIARKLLGL